MAKKNLSLILSFFILVFVFSSCSDDDNDSDIGGTEVDGNPGVENDIDPDFVTNTQDTIFQNAITIAYSGTSVDVNNPFQDNGISIAVDGTNVVVTSTISGTEVNYVLSGSTTSGSFKIYSDYKFGLGLNGVDIISADGPAINIQSKKKASIQLVGSTNNRLIDGTIYTSYGDEDMKGTIFSEGQLVFDGAGNLIVQGRSKHGIATDDYFRVKGGNIAVSGAAKDAVHANDYIQIDGGSLNLQSTSDGLECEKGYILINNGVIDITSYDGDAVKTSYTGTDTSIEPYILVNNGNINITTKGKGSKGFKSKGDVTILGGMLTFNSLGEAYYDTAEADITSASAIKVAKNFLMQAGSVSISSTGSGGKGINVDGTFTVDGGSISVTTTGDQFVSNGDDTAAKAIKSEGNLTINDGTIIIKTSKTEAEGLESKSTLTINGGIIEIDAYDDCINAANHIAINGGSVYCYSEANDGIDSNGTLTITGGTIVSSGTVAPEEGFDCDNNTFKITGGVLVGFGGATSNPTSNVCTQYSVVYGAGSVTSGQLIHIESANGDEIMTVKAPRSYNQMTMLFSTPAMKANTTYSIYTGGSVAGGSDFHGLYDDVSYTRGTLSKSFTTSSMVTTVGSVSNAGGGGGFPR